MLNYWSHITAILSHFLFERKAECAPKSFFGWSLGSLMTLLSFCTNVLGELVWGTSLEASLHQSTQPNKVPLPQRKIIIFNLLCSFWNNTHAMQGGREPPPASLIIKLNSDGQWDGRCYGTRIPPTQSHQSYLLTQQISIEKTIVIDSVNHQFN